MTANKVNNKPTTTWIYTWNNYTDDDIDKLKLLEVTRHRCCKEVAETGTKHLQGSITFNRAYRLSQLKKLFPLVHWEPSKTTDSENYCIKGEIVIDDKKQQQGHRSDLDEITNKIKAGIDMRDIAYEHPGDFIRYHRGMMALQQILAPKTSFFEKDTEVIVVIGFPGVGKSKIAWQADPKLYNVPEPINGSVWFDGYMGQKTILLDDFYGWIKYHTLLQWTHGHPLQLPVKGGFTHKNWDTVYITSNKEPEKWYSSRDEIDALRRRITKTIDLRIISNE